MEEMKEQAVRFEEKTIMPLLPLRGLTVYPGMMLNFDVERAVSVMALNLSVGVNQTIFLSTQKNVSKELPRLEDIYEVGTFCRLKQLLRQPNGKSVRVMVEGVARGRILRQVSDEPCMMVEVEPMPDQPERADTARAEALRRQCCDLYEEYAQLLGNIPPESLMNIYDSEDLAYVSNYISQHMAIRYSDKQKLLEQVRPTRRLAMLVKLLARENELLRIRNELQEETQQQLMRGQQEMFLREQLKVIQSRLGMGDDGVGEFDEYRQKIKALSLPAETEEKLLKELDRLTKQQYGSAEAAVIRTYLDTCLDLPWRTKTKETVDVTRARKMLDEDHYGLDKVKERVIEFLAVRQLAPQAKGSVLCLVGPPGTGKTSIAMSIARAMNRRLARISLGGVHDEAEIRGHRKTYIGAMPGRIIAAVQQAKSSNPVIVLDEIDKLASDFRGDPASALLETLDTEQNYAFRDHYLEVPFDLSDVLFITTANTTSTIPRPLLDRMEVIELTSYTDEEKVHIAKTHLLPKQRKKHGLTARQLKVSDDALREIISRYTRESGVRVLERQLAAVCRKAAARIAKGEIKTLSVRANHLDELLGAPPFRREKLYADDEVGLVRGLAWTAVGGDVLDVEVSVVPGTGKIELTGNLGDVMKESARGALTFIRSRSDSLGLDPEFYRKKDLHIHFPEGAVPKDGPSAGITICTAVISALTGHPVRRDLAMTGELTIRGRVLPIGGLKEKTMAAFRAGITTVIVPAENEKDLEEIDQDVRRALNFILVDHMSKVIETVFPEGFAPAVLPEGESAAETAQPGKAQQV